MHILIQEYYNKFGEFCDYNLAGFNNDPEILRKKINDKFQETANSVSTLVWIGTNVAEYKINDKLNTKYIIQEIPEIA